MTKQEFINLEITSCEQAISLIGKENFNDCYMYGYDDPNDIESYDMDDIIYIALEIIDGNMEKR